MMKKLLLTPLLLLGCLFAIAQTPKINNTIETGTAKLNKNTLTEPTLLMYPNPTKGQLHIKTATTAINYSLYNVLGQPVGIKGTASANRTIAINLTHLKDGVYLLKAKITDDNYKTFKIVKRNK